MIERLLSKKADARVPPLAAHSLAAGPDHCAVAPDGPPAVIVPAGPHAKDIMSKEQRVAVITRAYQGIGAALAKAYRDRKYRVVATSRSIGARARFSQTTKAPNASRPRCPRSERWTLSSFAPAP